MAKVRIGHFVEAQILEAMEVDCIDESEVLTPADEQFHVDKRSVQDVPFVCGCRDLGEALRRVARGRGDDPHQGRGRHRRHRRGGASPARGPSARSYEAHDRACLQEALDGSAPTKLPRAGRAGPRWVARSTGEMPVPNFSAGGVATPADAALMHAARCAESVFVGSSGIFKADDPVKRAPKRSCKAVTHFAGAGERWSRSSMRSRRRRCAGARWLAIWASRSTWPTRGW